MAQHGSDQVFILIGGYSLTGTRTTINFAQDAAMEDTTPFGVTDSTTGYSGMKKGSLSHGGFYDDSAGASNDALVAVNGSSQVGAIGLAGNTFGVPFTGFAGIIQSSYKRLATVGKLTRADADTMTNGIIEANGAVLFPLGSANSSTAFGTALNNTASSSAGMVSYVECTELVLGNRTNLIVALQDSPDGVTYTDRIIHTAITAAPAAERLTLAGATAQYTRTRYTWTGGTTGQSATIFHGFVRN